ncbi:hypothetical protein NUG13_12420 [Bacillus subtilis]|uniref:Uncharacterized protein n=1 Tax=Bacillus phage vB_BsuS_PJN02 TaxID=2920374 RepID=A0AC61TSI6_9CAUD|nr:hypothetical protein [Bacillus subtilis]YP_010681832.1 hypothetical protein PQE76_gp214 [Bacillus phage vB_BsuS_PJN02]MCR4362135.1 hypothetical protein [Bacillus subtilis]UNH58557.1 hypothetical protein [Bacillus phage vB_BsuS_PJN02]WOF32888.1 hypothetical protein OEJ84_23605 [Bacillus subtilis]
MNKITIQNRMGEIEMLWRIAEGTKYESDVSIAFDCLQQHRDRIAEGKGS